MNQGEAKKKIDIEARLYMNLLQLKEAKKRKMNAPQKGRRRLNFLGKIFSVFWGGFWIAPKVEKWFL